MAPIIFFAALSCGLWGVYRLVEGADAMRVRRLNGLACLGLLVAGFSGGREIVKNDRQPQTVYRQPATVNHRLLTVGGASLAVFHAPSTVDDAPFVGSTIKDVYHRSGCRYARLMQHPHEYASHADARADGKQPCKECLPVIQ